MSIDADTPLAAEDDTDHPASSDHPLWVETAWWCWNVPDAPDLRDIAFPDGGFSVKMLTPLMDYHVAYQDPERRFGVEFEHRGVLPPRRFTPGEPPAMHNPHLDQLGHMTGEMARDREGAGPRTHPIHLWSHRRGDGVPGLRPTAGRERSGLVADERGVAAQGRRLCAARQDEEPHAQLSRSGDGLERPHGKGELDVYSSIIYTFHTSALDRARMSRVGTRTARKPWRRPS